MVASPSVENLYIGKGTITFQATGETTPRALGEVLELEITPTIEKLDHFTRTTGVRTKDKSIVIEKALTLRLVMEEFTAENVSLLLLGTTTTNTAGDGVVEIFDQNTVEGVLRYTGTNEVGPQLDVELLNVSFSPSGSLNLLGDEWGQMELSGECLVDGTGSFGTVTVRDQA
ncbi:MAG: hypothetical protein V4747_11470 [Pseudomonadota bacterium]